MAPLFVFIGYLSKLILVISDECYYKEHCFAKYLAEFF